MNRQQRVTISILQKRRRKEFEIARDRSGNRFHSPRFFDPRRRRIPRFNRTTNTICLRSNCIFKLIDDWEQREFIFRVIIEMDTLERIITADRFVERIISTIHFTGTFVRLNCLPRFFFLFFFLINVLPYLVFGKCRRLKKENWTRVDYSLEFYLRADSMIQFSEFVNSTSCRRATIIGVIGGKCQELCQGFEMLKVGMAR